MAGLSFGIAGFAGAYDIIVKISSREQETRYLRSIFYISMFMVFSSTLPLVLADQTTNSIGISSAAVACGATVIYVYLLWEIITGKTAIQNKAIFSLLFPISFIMIGAIGLNALFKSTALYKAGIFWGVFVLYYRFYLFSIHVVRIKEK